LIGDTQAELDAIRELIAAYPSPVKATAVHRVLSRPDESPDVPWIGAPRRVRIRAGLAYLGCACYSEEEAHERQLFTWVNQKPGQRLDVRDIPDDVAWAAARRLEKRGVLERYGEGWRCRGRLLE
jgi:hypothetical protein